MICGAPREGRKLRGTGSWPTVPKRRSAFSGSRRPRTSRPSGPTTYSSRSPKVFRMPCSQSFSALIPPRASTSDAWMAADGRRCISAGSLSREAMVNVVAMLLPTMRVIASKNSRNILENRLCMRPGKGVAGAPDVFDFRMRAGLEIELAAQVADVRVNAAVVGGKLAPERLLRHRVSRNDLARGAHEQFEHSKFGARERHGLARDVHLAGARVQGDGA